MQWLIYLSAAGVIAALSLTVLILLLLHVDDVIIISKDNVHLTVPLQNIYATSENEEGDAEGEDNTEQDTEQDTDEEEEDGNNSNLDQIIEKSFVEKTALPNNTLTLVSYTLVRDPILDDPILEVQGEIRNDGTAAQEFVRINATFYNDEDEIVGTDYAYADSDVLEVCQLAPFELSVGFEDDVPIDEIDYIKFHLDSQAADEDDENSDVEGDSSVSETGEPEGDLTEPGEC
jgi:hypothetical protein